MEILRSSPWVPVEWIEAHGFAPRGIWGRTGLPKSALPEGVCAFAQRLTALAAEQPEQPMILTTACDPMRRGADDLAAVSGARVFVFNLPATWQTAAARRIYHAEMERLGRFLLRIGGHSPTLKGLAGLVAAHSARRTQLFEILRSCSAQQSTAALRQYFHDGTVMADLPADPADDAGIPVAVVGGPLVRSHFELVEVLSSLGARVVLDATEPGERCLVPPLNSLPGPDPLPSVLANHYFDHLLDVFQRPNSPLYRWLSDRLSKRGTRGIVLPVQVGCDLWRAEAESLREAFGLPVLLLESHDPAPNSARDTNRLAAFVESLQ